MTSPPQRSASWFIDEFPPEGALPSGALVTRLGDLFLGFYVLKPLFFCFCASAGARHKWPEGAPMSPQPLPRALRGKGWDFTPAPPLSGSMGALHRPVRGGADACNGVRFAFPA
jgi:hypothetical protein